MPPHSVSSRSSTTSFLLRPSRVRRAALISCTASRNTGLAKAILPMYQSLGSKAWPRAAAPQCCASSAKSCASSSAQRTSCAFICNSAHATPPCFKSPTPKPRTKAGTVHSGTKSARKRRAAAASSAAKRCTSSSSCWTSTCPPWHSAAKAAETACGRVHTTAQSGACCHTACSGSNALSTAP